MGTQERKKRERIALKQLIIQNAHLIVSKKGVAGLTMRSLAQQIDYSQSKIYQFFSGKQDLLIALCKDLSHQMYAELNNIPHTLPPKKFLEELVLKSIVFHQTHPHSDEVFTAVCFGPEANRIPQAFLEVEALFINALRRLESPYIRTEKEIVISLDMIRCLFIGASTLMKTETPESGRERAMNMSENMIKILIQGWT